MKLTLFENFSNLTFQAILGRDHTKVFTYKEPTELRHASILSGKATWTMEMEPTKWGWDLGTPSLISISLDLEIEDPETGEVSETSLEITKFDADLVSYEIKGFPLHLTEIEIDMRHTKQTEYWKYSLTIGDDLD